MGTSLDPSPLLSANIFENTGADSFAIMAILKTKASKHPAAPGGLDLASFTNVNYLPCSLMGISALPLDQMMDLDTVLG